ncbi:MAG: YitT family protein [Clostridiales bacterium]|nr:YitT family protein [Clostridiales bacterium]
MKLKLPKIPSVLFDYLIIMIGTTLISFAIKSIYDPISLVTGGFSGIGIIVKDITGGLLDDGIPLWFTNLALNIPMFFVSGKVKGRKFIGRTIFATFFMSLALYVLPDIEIMTDDLVLASIFGGVITGIGMGMVLWARATTGGTDMLATIIQHYHKHYSIAEILQVLDAVIVLAGAFLFGLNKALYAIIAIYLVSQVSDGILEGLKFSKLAYIISDHSKEIAAGIMKELDRGVTGLYAKGMYTNIDKKILICVVSKKQIVQLRELIAEIDPNSFVIVSDVREVFGEGFIQYNQ